MEFNIRAGVHGFWVAGGTGESVLLDDEENQRIAQIAADQNAGRTQVIMHVGANTTARAEKLAAHAAQAGVEAVCAVPPFFYQGDDDGVVEYYRAVGAAADRPLFIYNLPGCTGLDVSPALMQRLVEEVPQTTGLKHSSPVFANLIEFVGMGLDAFIGSGKLMLPAMTVGAVGSVDGPLCAAPELWMDVWNAYQAGDLAAAKQAQERASCLSPHSGAIWLFRQYLGRGRSTYRDGVRATLGVRCDPCVPRNARRCWRRWRLLGLTYEIRNSRIL